MEINLLPSFLLNPDHRGDNTVHDHVIANENSMSNDAVLEENGDIQRTAEEDNDARHDDDSPAATEEHSLSGSLPGTGESASPVVPESRAPRPTATRAS